MNWTEWLLLPPIAALIGWFTNFLAVRMIFRPRRQVSILGLKVQGLLPKRRAEFARSIAETVEEHLVTRDDVRRMVQDPEVHGRVLDLVSLRIDRFIEEKLVGGMPMLAGFMKGPFVDSMKARLIEEVSATIDEGAVLVGDEIDRRFDLREMIEAKIKAFDVGKLEAIVLSVARRELRAIEVLGAVLGLFVGLVQVGLLRLLS